MMVGYAGDHDGDCYKMLNMNTKQILQSRDVTWLGQNYFMTKNSDNEGDMHLMADQPSQNYEDEDWEEKYEQEELPNLVPPVNDKDNLANEEDNIPLTPSKTHSGLEYQEILFDEVMAVGAGIGEDSLILLS